jgi:hypothetical protein
MTLYMISLSWVSLCFYFNPEENSTISNVDSTRCSYSLKMSYMSSKSKIQHVYCCVVTALRALLCVMWVMCSKEFSNRTRGLGCVRSSLIAVSPRNVPIWIGRATNFVPCSLIQPMFHVFPLQFYGLSCARILICQLPDPVSPAFRSLLVPTSEIVVLSVK